MFESGTICANTSRGRASERYAAYRELRRIIMVTPNAQPIRAKLHTQIPINVLNDLGGVRSQLSWRGRKTSQDRRRNRSCVYEFDLLPQVQCVRNALE